MKMKKVRIFYASVLSDKASLNYEDFDCDSFEVAPHVLIIHQPSGPKYFPLISVRSFAELSE